MMGRTHATQKPLGLRGRLDTLPRRFSTKCGPQDPDSRCIPWLGTVTTSGYGQLDHRNAHRISYYLATGVDPGRLVVRHTCDNRTCVNPDHLVLGSQKDNIADMYARDRANNPVKVGDDGVQAIRRLAATERTRLT